jgi:hypothetical protein
MSEPSTNLPNEEITKETKVIDEVQEEITEPTPKRILVKEKKPRSEKQIEAFNKLLEKRKLKKEQQLQERVSKKEEDRPITRKELAEIIKKHSMLQERVAPEKIPQVKEVREPTYQDYVDDYSKKLFT